MDKNGKAIDAAAVGASLSHGNTHHGSSHLHGSSQHDNFVSAGGDCHQPGQVVDSAQNGHSLEESESERLKTEKAKLLQAQGIFALANGYIRFDKIQLTKKDANRSKISIPDDQSPLDRDDEEAPIAEFTKTGIESTFRIIARRCNQPIVLFGDQMMRLIDELPNAYKAYEISDDSYKHVLVKNEKNIVTLEINFWQDKKYLYLKRYFKSSDDYRSGFFSAPLDKDGWVAAKGWVSFDPDHDLPIDILKYVLMCC